MIGQLIQEALVLDEPISDVTLWRTDCVNVSAAFAEPAAIGSRHAPSLDHGSRSRGGDGVLETWVQRVSDEVVRSQLRHALDIDRHLWSQYPSSLASCLLARTLGDLDLAELHARWTRELDERATP